MSNIPFYLFLSFFFALQFQQAFAQKIDGVAIVVGDEIITKNNLEKQIELSKMQDQTSSKCEFVNNLMVQMLLINEAKQDTLISVENDQIVERVNAQIESYTEKISETELLNLFGVNSMKELKEELEIQLKDQMYGQRIQAKLTSGINVSPNEVKKFYDKNKYDLPKVKEEVELAHIVFKPLISEENRIKVINKLKEIKNEIEQGADFSTKAYIYSEDPGSSSVGGLYTGIKRGKFVKEFEEVAFTLKEGQISDPLETQFGYHIIKLEKRRGEEIDVRHILMKIKPTKQEMLQTKLFADSIRTRILEGSLSFEDAAKEHSIDKFTKNNGGIVTNPQTGQTKQYKERLPIKLSFAITGLRENQLSDAFEDDFEDGQAIKIIRLNKKIPEHEMNYESDFEKLKNFTINEKKQNFIIKWANQRAKFTYIKMDDEYSGCISDINWNN